MSRLHKMAVTLDVKDEGIQRDLNVRRLFVNILYRRDLGSRMKGVTFSL